MKKLAFTLILGGLFALMGSAYIKDMLLFLRDGVGDKVQIKNSRRLITEYAKLGDELINELITLKENLNFTAQIYEALLEPSKEDKLSKKQQEALLKAKQIVAEHTNATQTDYEKALTLHNYLIINSNYENTQLSTIAEVNEVILDGKGVCHGYSLVYQILLHLAGVESKVIYGQTNTPHAWNLVKIDKEWMHVDCTWDDVMCSYPVYAYFGLSDERISRTHSWKRQDYPAATSEQLFYYTKDGLNFNQLSEFVDYVSKHAHGDNWAKSAFIRELDKEDLKERQIFSILQQAPHGIKFSYAKLSNTRGVIVLIASSKREQASKVKADNDLSASK